MLVWCVKIGNGCHHCAGVAGVAGEDVAGVAATLPDVLQGGLELIELRPDYRRYQGERRSGKQSLPPKKSGGLSARMEPSANMLG